MKKDRTEQQKAYYAAHKEDWRKRAEKNKEARRAYRHEYYLANRDKLIAARKAWRENNHEEALARDKDYAAKNKDKRNARSKKYYAENKDQFAENAKRWYAENHEYALTKQRERGKIARSESFELAKALKLKHGCQNPACVWNGKYEHSFLEFHHVNRLEKLFSIAQAYRFSIEEMTREITKCTILCANCHRLATFHGLDCSAFPRAV